MSDQSEGSNAEETSPQRIQELTWVLLDEQISAEEFNELENALLNDVQAREKYVGCVQLHTDLLTHFARDAAPPASASTKSPILGFLNAGMPPLGLQSNPVEGASS
ncbi:MAG TPA: hypothetical protein VHK01_20130 [Lacipirellulaceae bacterium]|nr:hypothetical protein [Lacipirellulaceae bacterium]